MPLFKNKYLYFQYFYKKILILFHFGDEMTHIAQLVMEFQNQTLKFRTFDLVNAFNMLIWIFNLSYFPRISGGIRRRVSPATIRRQA